MVLNKKIHIAFFLLLISIASQAQYTLTSGLSSLEVNGMLTCFYNKRFLHDTTTSAALNYKKNRFELGNARLEFDGRYANDYEYEIGFDLAKLTSQADIGETPAILNANFTFKKWSLFNIKVGYQKVPYSRFSLVPLSYSPYWQRGEIARGSVFSRRDVGITLFRSLWNQRINAYVGAYTGQGEAILTSLTGGDNDPSGKFELASRVDVSYPSRYRYRDVYDMRHVPTPMFSIGVNARYVKRAKSITGSTDYDLKVIAGYKTLSGIDISAQYKGFSLQAESHYMQITPTDTKLLQGKPTSYFRAGGTIVQVNYYTIKLRSGLSIRYDDFIPNDLIPNNTEKTISVAYNYMLKGTKSMLRLQYWYRMVDRFNSLLLRTDDQLRIGWQYVF